MRNLASFFVILAFSASVHAGEIVLEYQRADNMMAASGKPSASLGTESVSINAGDFVEFETDWKYEKTKGTSNKRYGSHLRVGSGRADEPHAAISLHNWKVCSAALTRGDIGFAESYMDGDWHSPDLAALVRLFIANRDSLQGLIYGSWWGGLLYRAKHLLNRNSRQGSRKNIHAHYDIGNDFYRLWLDQTMNYSSAWFDGHHELPMAQGQHAKVTRALRECGVRLHVCRLSCAESVAPSSTTASPAASLTRTPRRLRSRRTSTAR